MSRSLRVFLTSELDLDALVEEVSSVLGATFVRIESNGCVYFESKEPPQHLSISAHDFINDRDLNFEDYRYSIGIWAVGIPDGEERLRKQDQLGHEIFAKLKATGAFSMMLVDDVQKKLEEFKPDGSIE